MDMSTQRRGTWVISFPRKRKEEENNKDLVVDAWRGGRITKDKSKIGSSFGLKKPIIAQEKLAARRLTVLQRRWLRHLDKILMQSAFDQGVCSKGYKRETS